MSKKPERPPLHYASYQAEQDKVYQRAWHEWLRSQASYGVRARLKAGGAEGSKVKGMDKPWVERRGFVEGSETREQHEEDMARLDDLASHDRTAVVEIGEREVEPQDGETRRRGDEEREKQRLRNRHFHFFAMFMGTGAEQFELLKLRCIILLRHAAPYWLAHFGLINGSVIKEMRKLRAGFKVQGSGFDYIPLGDVLSGAVEQDEEDAAHELGLDVRAWRLVRFGEFCAEIGKQSKTLDQFVRNGAAWLRRTKPQEIEGLGRTQTALAAKLGQTRAAQSAREIVKVEGPQKAAGMKGYHGGGTKTPSHRRKCARAQRGNTNRADGERRKKAGREVKSEKGGGSETTNGHEETRIFSETKTRNNKVYQQLA